MTTEQAKAIAKYRIAIDRLRQVNSEQNRQAVAEARERCIALGVDPAFM